MVRAKDMAVRLRRLAQHYQPYRQLTGEELGERLAELGVEVKLLKGYPQVRADRVFAAIDRREEEDGE